PQRARPRARGAYAHGLEHRSGRGVVPRRPGQGRVPEGLPARFLFRRPARPRRVGPPARRYGPRAVRRCEQGPEGFVRAMKAVLVGAGALATIALLALLGLFLVVDGDFVK